MDQLSEIGLTELAESLRENGQVARALAVLSDAMDSSAILSSSFEIRLTLAKVLLDLGRAEESLAALEIARQIALASLNPQNRARADLLIAFVKMQAYHTMEPMEMVESVLAESRDLKWASLEADALAIKAHLIELEGDYPAALGLFQQALKAARSAKYLKRQVTTTSDIGRINGVLGNYADALDALKESSELAKSTSLSRQLLLNSFRIALVNIAIGDSAGGFKELETVEDKARRLSLQDLRSSALHQIGRFHLRSKLHLRALDTLRLAKETAVRFGLTRQRIYISLDIARCYRETSRSAEAIGELWELWVILQPLEPGFLQPLPYFLRELAENMPDSIGDELFGIATEADQIASMRGIYEDMGRKRQRQSLILERIALNVRKVFSDRFA